MNAQPAKESFARWFAKLFSLGMGVPAAPHSIPLGDTAPSGLQFIHASDTAAEGELLRQVLVNEGFHVEYVPAGRTGAWGAMGDTRIFVPEEEAERAREFVRDYLNADPTQEES